VTGRVDAEERHDLDHPYDKKWYECRKKNGSPDGSNVIANLSYVKLGATMMASSSRTRRRRFKLTAFKRFYL
jgi:hypothetical protein